MIMIMTMTMIITTIILITMALIRMEEHERVLQWKFWLEGVLIPAVGLPGFLGADHDGDEQEETYDDDDDDKMSQKSVSIECQDTPQSLTHHRYYNQGLIHQFALVVAVRGGLLT